MGFVNDLKNRMDMNTVDHDLGVILRCRLGPGPSGNRLFELQWHSDSIWFNARVKEQARAKGEETVQAPSHAVPIKYELVYVIRAISVPQGFPEKEDTLREVIKDALAVYGEAYNNSRINSVAVEYVSGAFEREVIRELV